MTRSRPNNKCKMIRWFCKMRSASPGADAWVPRLAVRARAENRHQPKLHPARKALAKPTLHSMSEEFAGFLHV